MGEPSCHSRIPFLEGRGSPAARGGGPRSLPVRAPGRRGPSGRRGPHGPPRARHAPAPLPGGLLCAAAPGPPAAPRLRPADPRALRPEGTRGTGPGAGFLGSHLSASARFILILPPGGGSSPGESGGNWEAARGTGNPSQGWGNQARYSVRSGLGDSPGAARTATPPARLAAEPSPRPPRAAAGPPGPRVEEAARGLRGQGLPRPSRPIGARPAARRAAGGRRSASQGRGASATDTCLQASAPARAPRSERPASSRPGGLWPAPRQPAGSSPGTSPSRAKPGPAPRGSDPRPAAEALGSSGSARGRSASAPGHPARLPASLGLAPAAAAASAHTHSRSNTQTHSCDSRGPEEAARRGDPPRPAPARLSCGDSTVPAARGGGARRQDGEGRREASRTPGRGLEAEISGPGRVPGSPRREEGRVERPGSPS